MKLTNYIPFLNLKNDVDALKAKSPTGTTNTGGIGDGLTIEDIDDRVNALIQTGANITKVYDDANNTLTLSAAGGGSGNTYNSTVNLTGGNLAATSSYASLEAAFAAIGSAPTTLMVNSVVPVSTDVTQPANIILFFVGGGRVNKTDSGKLSALNYVCDDEYQICFSGFTAAAGDLKCGLKVPSEISPCHFGAVAETLGDNPAVPTVGQFDTLPAVKLIEAAFTRTYGEASIKGTGTVIKFPAGDFWFSAEWRVGKNYGSKGAESNTGQFHATRLWFAKNGHGIVLKSVINSAGSTDSQSSGNIISHLGIRQDKLPQTNATVNITGSATFTDANIAANQITIANHPFLTGQRVSLSSSTAFSPLDTIGIYYVIKTGVNTLKLAIAPGDTSVWERQNAYDGTSINIPVSGNAASVFTLTSMEMVYVGGGAVQTNSIPYHVEDKPFAYPLNNGSIIRTADDLALTVIRQRKQLALSAAAAGATQLTLQPLTAQQVADGVQNTKFTPDDVDAEITLGAFFKTVITAVSGQTVTLRDALNNNIAANQNAYVVSGRRVDIEKVDFMMYVFDGINQIGALMSLPNIGGIVAGNLLLNQKVKFISPNGAAKDYTGEITSILGTAAFQVSPNIPAGFGGAPGVLQYGQVQSLKTTANLKVQIAKHAGVFIEDGNAATVENVGVSFFGGDGIAVSTDPTLQTTGNSNTITIRNCFLTFNVGNGLRTAGKESNAAFYEQINSVFNGGHGIYENGYIGSTINGGHLADNKSGTLYTAHGSHIRLEDKGTTRVTVTGLYAEGGQVGLNLGAATILTGGVNDVGFHPQSQAALAIYTGDPQGAIVGGSGLVLGSSSGKMRAKIKARSNNTLDNHFITAGGAGNGLATISDWGIGTGDLGDYGYIGQAGGTDPTNSRWILAWDFIKSAVLARILRIGDGSASINNYTQMTSDSAAPTSGSYPKGHIVWNRNPTGGGTVGWINIGDASAADWQTFGAIGSAASSGGGGSAPTSTPAVNYALASSGATIEVIQGATGVGSKDNLINGLRHTNSDWVSGAWKSSGGYPTVLEITLLAPQSITGVNVISLLESLDYVSEPSPSDTSTYSPAAYTVMLYDAATSQWLTKASVTGNDKVLSQSTFTAMTTTKIRVSVTGGNYAFTYLAEIEVLGS